MSLKSRFCAKCGKSVDNPVDNFCADCFLEQNAVSIPNKTSIRFCTKCNSVWLEGVWIKAANPPEDYLLKRVIDRIRLPEEVKLAEAEIVKMGKNGELKIILQLEKAKIEHIYNAQLIIDKYCCPECSREITTKYLAILQLRTDKDVSEFVKKVSRIASGSSRKQITKAQECLQGIDFYIASKEVARSIANEIKKRFKCKMTTSTKQHGWDRIRNRALTKLTILLRER